MSTGRYSFHEAHAAASLFLANVGYTCQCIAMAGSLRRLVSEYGDPESVPEEKTVGDIEIVAIPLFGETLAEVDIFGDEIAPGDPVNLLIERLELARYGLWPVVDKNGRTSIRAGAKYRKHAIPAPGDTQLLPCDLFLTTRQSWGYIFALRTGPLLWNEKGLVLRRAWGGLKPDDITFKGGMMYRGGSPEPLDVPTEEDFFEAMSIPHLPPHERSLEAVHQLREAA
jgi:hypothetical protein